MSTGRAHSSASPGAGAPADGGDPLAAIGLARGALVRFRRRDGGRWHLARVERLERDGSLGLRDEKGAARAIPVPMIEVAGDGPRGGRIWEPLAAVIARTEQLRLL